MERLDVELAAQTPPGLVSNPQYFIVPNFVGGRLTWPNEITIDLSL